MAKKGGLGKGLDALFLDNDAQVGEGLMSLRISTIEPNKDQPRDRFDQGPSASWPIPSGSTGCYSPL